MTKKQIPNPGSDKAIKQGCTCAILDNGHGHGALDLPDGQFWITAGCPLHDKRIGQEELVERIAKQFRALFFEARAFPPNTPIEVEAHFSKLARQLLKDNNLVELDKDQSLPPCFDDNRPRAKAFRDMVEASWRKVKVK